MRKRHDSWSDFFEKVFAEKPTEVLLNNDYTAKVTKEGVKVGCQTFSHDAIIKLYEASQNIL